MSETEFALLVNTDSVETCAENVRSSDVLLLIFDRRYGPSIPGRGSASATKIEYEAARTAGVPVITFARKEFLQEFRLYQVLFRKGTTAADIADHLQHVSKKRVGTRYEFELLFEFFDSIRKVTLPESNNWFDPFTDAVELAESMLKRLSEILASDVWHLQRVLNVATFSRPDDQVALSAKLTKSALESLDRLKTTQQH